MTSPMSIAYTLHTHNVTHEYYKTHDSAYAFCLLRVPSFFQSSLQKKGNAIVGDTKKEIVFLFSSFFTQARRMKFELVGIIN